MAGIKVYLTQEVTDKNGKRIFYRKRASHSFTLQFLDILAQNMNHAINAVGVAENVNDTGGAARAIQQAAACQSLDMWAVTSGGGTTTYGIVMGTGTNAESGADTGLQTLIAEGAGAGQLNYGGCSVTTAVQAGGITTMTIARGAGNNSGGLITVEEVAVYTAHEDNATTTRFFCILRDLTGGIAVNNGQTYTVTYTLQTSV